MKSEQGVGKETRAVDGRNCGGERKPSCAAGHGVCQGRELVRYACEVPNRLYDAIPCGIVHMTAEEHPQLVFINKKGCDILGYADVEDFQHHAQDNALFAIPESDAVQVRKAIDRLTEGAPVCDFHHRIRRADGSIGWVRGTATIAEEASDPPVIQASFSDVSRVHEARNARDRERYAAVLCTAFAEVYEINTAHDTCRLLKLAVPGEEAPEALPIEDVLERWAALIVSDEDRERVLAAVRSFRRDEAPGPLVLSYRLMFDAREMWCQSTFLRMNDESFLCCNKDISDRMRHESEAISRAVGDVVSKLPVGIGVYSLRGDGLYPLYASDPVCAMLGYTREEYDRRIASGRPLIGKDELDGLMSPADRDQLVAHGYNVEVPVQRKDGSSFMVRVRGAAERVSDDEIALYSAVLDITDELRARRATAWQNERFRILSELTRAISFDYDSETDTVLIYIDEGDGMKPHVIHRYLENLEQERVGVVHPDSIGPVRQLFTRVARGEDKHAMLDFRADYYKTGFRWYRANLFVVDDEGGTWHLIGLIQDIQDERDFRQQAECDLMTGISNHATTKRLIDDVLADPQARAGCVCALIDVDDFKNVNDRCGHLRGDELLQDVGAFMRGACRSTDIVGRIGGDEFALLFRGIKLEDALVKLDSIRTQVVDLTASSTGLSDVSLSIGVCEVGPDDGTCDAVFAKADEALYASKRAGKNRVTVYA
ncbi:sensor domain-containing diguanylate cyclase [Arabiibacter massiliensis]|uniref:sensor domain-containing diguanylate cyclase n=1 Tax=Arabiibacter massiliensis TaxID=1870985 RepID=UPI00155A072C|nr:diguanylate cyclase [Arabiibacter massiliensis]